jgi:hypothetical protein
VISLSNQLRDDYISLFQDDDKVKELYSDYNGEYKDIVIKNQYEKYPKISYPMITISEINNEDVNQYYDDSGECVSYLGYQIQINAEQTENKTALENAQIIGEIIDSYMKTDKYKCMRRIGDFTKAPMSSDNNIIIGYLRYECYLDINTNTIYRRY